MIEIVIPTNPVRALSPNASRETHWSTKAKARDELRHASFYAAKEAIQVYESTHGDFVALRGAVRVKTTIAWGKGRQHMDGDNALASLKAGFDQLTTAGIWTDDRYCLFDPVEQIRDKAGVGYVKIVAIQEGP